MSSRFAIASPCPKTWADLRGDGRQRYCDVCQRSVHALEQYSQEERDQLWRESDGRVCGLLCGESPPEPRSRRALLIGALLTAISPLMAQTGRLRIRVSDQSGAMVSGAVATVLGTEDKPITARANEAGEIVLTDLPIGDCRITINQAGFKARKLTVTILNGDEVKIETVLEVGSIGETVEVEAHPAAYEKTLPAPTAVSTPAPQPKRSKRWLIFR